MFSRNPNDPAQIAIRLANRKVAAEANVEAFRKALADLTQFLADSRDALGRTPEPPKPNPLVPENKEAKETYDNLRSFIESKLLEHLKPLTKVFQGLRRMAKRGSPYVKEPLAHLEAAMFQMLATAESLPTLKVADFRPEIHQIQVDFATIVASLDNTVDIAKTEEKRSLLDVNTICLPLMAVGAIALVVLMGHFAWSNFFGTHPDLGQGASQVMMLLLCLVGSIACVCGTVRHIVAYYKATAPSNLADAECEA